MAKLYANENFPLPVVSELRALDHDVMTIRDDGHAGRAAPDEAVLDFATAQGRAILTLNRRHFVRLHAARPGHAGIIVCTYDPDFPAQARRVHATVTDGGPLAGRLVRVNRV